MDKENNSLTGEGIVAIVLGLTFVRRIDLFPINMKI